MASSSSDGTVEPQLAPIGDEVAALLVNLGIRRAFGVIGGAIAPLVTALHRGGIEIIHTRHEAGAVFCAMEAQMATGQTCAAFATTGPGIMNALTGVFAARWDGAKLVLLSGTTSPPFRGRGAVQETSAYTMPLGGLLTSGTLFHFGTAIEEARELIEAGRRLSVGLTSPGGFVAHLSFPLSVQGRLTFKLPRPRAPATVSPPACPADVVSEVANRLNGDRFALWVGFGAASSSHLVRAVAEKTAAAVMCSPRGKGIFPEDHPLFVGVTGAGSQPGPKAYMSALRPAHLLVLGTKLSEATSFFDESLTPSRAFIHVDLDPSVPGAAFPETEAFGVEAEIGTFLQALLPLLHERPDGGVEDPRRCGFGVERPSSPRARPGGPVRPQVLMAAVQKIVVEGSDALVMTESGNAFAWGNQLLRFNEPGRYRTSAAWGAMGHMVTGAVGAAHASGKKVVALVGDGAMLMLNELNTAVGLSANAVWVVLNDARYGIVQQAMRAQGLVAIDTDMPRVDFALFAKSVGASGVRVTKESELTAALMEAMAAVGPFVVDVEIDREEISPVLSQRVQSLTEQSAKRRKDPR